MCLLSSLNTPANLLDIFRDVTVADLVFLDALGCCAPVVPLLLDAVGDCLFKARDDPLLNGSWP